MSLNLEGADLTARVAVLEREVEKLKTEIDEIKRTTGFKLDVLSKRVGSLELRLLGGGSIIYVVMEGVKLYFGQ